MWLKIVKSALILEKNTLIMVNIWVTFLIWNPVLRIYRKKHSFFSLRPLLGVLWIKECISKRPHSKKPRLSWKIPDCVPMYERSSMRWPFSSVSLALSLVSSELDAFSISPWKFSVISASISPPINQKHTIKPFVITRKYRELDRKP